MEPKISCTYVGQSTVIINIGVTRIITDLNLSGRVLFSPRRHPLPVNPAAIPEPAAILISHTHCDHLDISSYKYISCGVPIIVPEGCDHAVLKYLPNPVIELNHFAKHELADGAEIMAAPVVHSRSHIFPWFGTRSNAYIISRSDVDGSVYFCGDSAYGPHFSETANLARIEMALLPIGSYLPRWLLRKSHMTPAEAVNAFEDLKAGHMVPIHYGTFRLSLENPSEPAGWLKKIMEERPDLAPKIHLLEPGQSAAI